MAYTADMRYNTNLFTPYQMRLNDDIKVNRPLVFARDLVYFVIHKYQRKWHPLIYKTYTIHERSPLTHAVRRAVDLLLEGMDHVYAFNYYQLVEPHGEGKLLEFAVIARSVFDRFMNLEKKSVNVLFDVLVYVARMSVECEIHGVRDAPHLAVVMINLFLMPFDRDVFVLFHQQAHDIVDLCSPGEVPAQIRSVL